MRFAKIVSITVVALPVAATLTAASDLRAGFGLRAFTPAAAGAPVAPFIGGGASSFSNWRITSQGAVANLDAATRAWVLPLVAASTVSDQIVDQIGASALCSTGSTAQLVTTDIAGNVLSANSAVNCVTGLNTSLGTDALATGVYTSRVIFNLATNGNALWAGYTLTTQ